MLGWDVIVPVAVRVAVPDGMAVCVLLAADVAVDAPVEVLVLVLVFVPVLLAVLVDVSVGVLVRVDVLVEVAVPVDVLLGMEVDVDVLVSVGVGVSAHACAPTSLMSTVLAEKLLPWTLAHTWGELPRPKYRSERLLWSPSVVVFAV